MPHVTLGDVLENHWSDIQTFACVLLVILLAKTVLSR